MFRKPGWLNVPSFPSLGSCLRTQFHCRLQDHLHYLSPRRAIMLQVQHNYDMVGSLPDAFEGVTRSVQSAAGVSLIFSSPATRSAAISSSVVVFFFPFSFSAAAVWG